MAARIGVAPAIAYAHSMYLFMSAFLGPAPRKTFETMAAAAVAAAAHVDDPYLQYLVRSAIGYGELFRGRAGRALAAAEDILSLGGKLDDPSCQVGACFSNR